MDVFLSPSRGLYILLQECLCNQGKNGERLGEGLDVKDLGPGDFLYKARLLRMSHFEIGALRYLKRKKI